MKIHENEFRVNKHLKGGVAVSVAFRLCFVQNEVSKNEGLDTAMLSQSEYSNIKNTPDRQETNKKIRISRMHK